MPGGHLIVNFAGEWEEMGDVFRDTPYEAKRQGVEFVSECLRSNTITKGEWGKKFLESIHKEIDLMYTPEGPDNLLFTYSSFDDDYVYCECGFANSFEAIIRGAIAGEPDLMYLLAETLNYNLNDMMIDGIKEALTFLSGDDQNLSLCEFYLRAAVAGSSYAGLWCAFSLDTGKNGFSKDPLRAGKMLDKIEYIPHTLSLAELSFLPEEIDKLNKKAYDVDLEEDLIEDQYRFIPGNHAHLLPKPSWLQLCGRTGNALVFMSKIGLPYVIGKEVCAQSEYFCGSFLNDKKIAEEKNAWLAWCHKKGLDIKLM